MLSDHWFDLRCFTVVKYLLIGVFTYSIFQRYYVEQNTTFHAIFDVRLFHSDYFKSISGSRTGILVLPLKRYLLFSFK